MGVQVLSPGTGYPRYATDTHTQGRRQKNFQGGNGKTKTKKSSLYFVCGGVLDAMGIRPGLTSSCIKKPE